MLGVVHPSFSCPARSWGNTARHHTHRGVSSDGCSSAAEEIAAALVRQSCVEQQVEHRFTGSREPEDRTRVPTPTAAYLHHGKARSAESWRQSDSLVCLMPVAPAGVQGADPMLPLCDGLLYVLRLPPPPASAVPSEPGWCGETAGCRAAALCGRDGGCGGVLPHAGTLQSALAELVRPLLVLAHVGEWVVDDTGPDALEKAYQACESAVHEYNDCLSAHMASEGFRLVPGGPLAKPGTGNVVFVCGGGKYDAWGFSVDTFARLYAAKFGVSEERIARRLWGDNYYDEADKTWSASPGPGRVRGFSHFIMRPLRLLRTAALQCCAAAKAAKAAAASAEEGATEEAQALAACWAELRRMAVALGASDDSVAGLHSVVTSLGSAEAVWECVAGVCFPLSPAVLGAATAHLPSPVEAMKYRARHLLRECGGGTVGAALERFVAGCSRDGPLLLRVGKIVSPGGLCVVRVFSGLASRDERVVVAPPPNEGRREDWMEAPVVASPILPSAGPLALWPEWRHVVSSFVSRSFGPGTVFAVGQSWTKWLLRNGAQAGTATVHSDHEPMCSAPLYRFAAPLCGATTRKPEALHRIDFHSDNPRFHPCISEAMRCLPHACAPRNIVVKVEETGVFSAGVEWGADGVEAMLRKWVSGAGGPDALAALSVSQPYFAVKEGVTKRGERQSERSPNRHNHITGSVSPLGEPLSKFVEDLHPWDGFGESRHAKERASFLAESFAWDAQEARRIWAFGCVNSRANVLVDLTKRVQYMSELRDSCEAGFTRACESGTLCGAPLRGVRFDIENAVMHADAIHRGAGQILGTTARCVTEGVRSAEPFLYLPHYTLWYLAPTGVHSEVLPCYAVGTTLLHNAATRFERQRTYIGCYFSGWVPEKGPEARMVIDSERRRKGLFSET